jgi:hypothetical protein
MSDRLEIQYVPIDSVKPWGKNPKRHNMDAIKNSIRDFKMTKPILVQKGSRMVIAGHGRLQALKELGYTEVPVIELEMSDKRAKAYALVDNETTMSEGWDYELLDDVLNEIELELPELSMDDYGFASSLDITDDGTTSLMETLEGGFSNGVKNESEEFAVTFTFHKKDQAAIEGYLKENGKPYLAAQIIKVVNGENPLEPSDA